MKADFSRLQFNLNKGYTRVLQQQGRVSLDADWNEQVSLQADLDRKRLVDLIGVCGAPQDNPGFLITATGSNLQIGGGIFYVNGLRIELDDPVHYSGASQQPFLPDPPALTDPGSNTRLDLVYLCVRERHVTYLEDDDIREVALGGPDTTTRVQTIWQVRVRENVSDISRCEEDVTALLPDRVGGGQLTTVTTPPNIEDDPCVTPTGSGYRGLENRLYRVEVYQGGAIGGAATIKWSRYNGAVAFLLVRDSINESTRTLELTRLGWDQIRTLKQNDWIELVSEADEFNGAPGAIVQIDSGAGAVDEARRQVTIKDEPEYVAALAHYRTQQKVKVRLWNGASGEISLAGNQDPTDATRTNPIDLEDGIQIVLSVDNAADEFRSGDYWTFKARTIADADGNTLDPLRAEPPHGPFLYCCKLALIHWNDPDTGAVIEDCRPIFPPLTELLALHYVSGDGQEGMPGRVLPGELVVRVNRGEHPVANVPINFVLQNPGHGAALLDGSDNPVSAPIYTNDYGLAQVRWRLGSDRAVWSQQVQAFIDAPGDARQHLQVRFNANLSLAEQVSYRPPEGCTNLEGTTNVAEALDALCHISGEDDPGFHITGIFWRNANGTVGAAARHDETVGMDRFVDGLCIECDAPPEPPMVTPATCYMQLELSLAGDLLPQLLSEYTIPGLVEVREERRICWRPAPTAREGLNQLFSLVGNAEPILARLTVKGSYIHRQNDSQIYLDGEVTSTLAGVTPHNLNLPSGDGKRGGDFQMWFNIRRFIEEPEPLDRIRWAVDGISFPQIHRLDPILVTEPQDITAINLLFGGLMRLNERGEPVVDLAENFEIDENGLDYRFFLREGQEFSNGSSLTADDVVFSLDRARDPNNTATGPIYLWLIEEVGVVDDLTVAITLRQPSRFFLQQLTTPPAKIVNAEAVREERVAETASGAFVLRERNDPLLVLDQNPDYWQPAGVEGIDLHYVPSRETAVAMYEAGEVDVAGSVQTGLPREAAEFEGFVSVDDSCAIRYLNFIHTRIEWNAIEFEALSLAINHAIDRQQLVDAIGEDVLSAHRLLPSCIPGVSDLDSSMTQYDDELSRDALESIGWTVRSDGLRERDGVTLEFVLLYATEGNEVNRTAMQIIQENFGNVGIHLEFHAVDLRGFSATLHSMARDPYSARYHLYYSIWTADYLDPQNLLSQQLHSIQDPHQDPQHLNNNGHFHREDFDSLVDEADKYQNILADYYQEAEEIALRHGGWIPLFYPRARALIRSSVEGLTLTGRGIMVPNFSNLRIT